MRTIYFITHPNVVIDCRVPIPQWPLSELGLKRMRFGLSHQWIREITSLYSSEEQKAIDGAEVLSQHLSLPYKKIADLGEIDRSSTGYLPLEEFEKTADDFFANPETSVRGWERAVDAQARIVQTVLALINGDTSTGSIAIVSHGAVGALLYSYLTDKRISRTFDQPPNNGGNFYHFSLNPTKVSSGWQVFDDPSMS